MTVICEISLLLLGAVIVIDRPGHQKKKTAYSTASTSFHIFHKTS